MLEIHYSKQFLRDLKKTKRQGKHLYKIHNIMQSLANDEQLPSRYRDHRLSGNYSKHRECHIEPDWLLIYYKTETMVVFERTGSHSELFD